MIRPSTDRGQTESLGSLLLVAVVVVSAGTFGAYYVASTTDRPASGTDNFDFVVTVTGDELRIAHNGGPSVARADLQVTVENASGEFTYQFEDGTVRGGDGDDRFEPGETWRLAWDQSPDTEVTVSLIDTADDRLLFRRSATVGAATTARPA